MDKGYVQQPQKVEKLDTEDDEARQKRFRSVFEHLNSTSSTPHVASKPMFPAFGFGDVSYHPIKPHDELLSRVQSFLPQFRASNTLLAQNMHDDSMSVDIENVKEGEARYIEMNLSLGVYEDHSRIKVTRADDGDGELSSSASASTTSTSTSDTTSDLDFSDYDSDSSSEIITCFVPSRPVKPLPRRRARPHIVVLGD